jgi:hypothetical protein
LWVNVAKGDWNLGSQGAGAGITIFGAAGRDAKMAKGDVQIGLGDSAVMLEFFSWGIQKIADKNAAERIQCFARIGEGVNPQVGENLDRRVFSEIPKSKAGDGFPCQRAAEKCSGLFGIPPKMRAVFLRIFHQPIHRDGIIVGAIGFQSGKGGNVIEAHGVCEGLIFRW